MEYIKRIIPFFIFILFISCSSNQQLLSLEEYDDLYFTGQNKELIVYHDDYYDDNHRNFQTFQTTNLFYHSNFMFPYTYRHLNWMNPYYLYPYSYHWNTFYTPIIWIHNIPLNNTRSMLDRGPRSSRGGVFNINSNNQNTTNRTNFPPRERNVESSPRVRSSERSQHNRAVAPNTRNVRPAKTSPRNSYRSPRQNVRPSQQRMSSPSRNTTMPSQRRATPTNKNNRR